MVASSLSVNSSNVRVDKRPHIPCIADQQARWVLNQIQTGHTLTINSQQRNGLIICKPFHAEFAGPGAMVGGSLDSDCRELIVIGHLSVQPPGSYEDSHKAYCVRQAWNRLIHGFTQLESSSQRAKKVLTQFELYFGKETVTQIPDQVLALLARVSPQTIQAKRLHYSVKK
ncbi:MAG: hypothetical protein F6K30_02105 [Cyanothece sp. SIO2G6]|nr:hypothetical protein [Cyanothece sp. SIO2G6]